jgi:hypothetical protein
VSAWSALKSGLLGASASGAVLALGAVLGAVVAGLGLAGALLAGRAWAGAGGATPIGRICATAGLKAIPATAENNSNELDRCFIGPTNLFI